MAEREAASTKWVTQPDADVEHELVSCDRGHCRMCGRITRWRCACVVQPPREPGKPRRKEGSAMYLCPASKRRCQLYLTWKVLYLKIRRSRQHFRGGREVGHHLELMNSNILDLCVSFCNDVHTIKINIVNNNHLIALNTYSTPIQCAHVCTLYLEASVLEVQKCDADDSR